MLRNGTGCIHRNGGLDVPGKSSGNVRKRQVNERMFIQVVSY